jgi:2,4-dienoyl-CoA reductase (NADPH2)
VPAIPGIDGPNVHGYADVISGRVELGRRVAIIGAGGIGFDVAEFLTHAGPHGEPQPRTEWMAEWGVGDPGEHRGGLVTAVRQEVPREVFLLQRKPSRVGAGLNKTSGWVHRAALAQRGVEMLRAVNYESIDAAGLHVTFGERRADARTIEVDDIVVCAGQEPRRELADELRAGHVRVHLVGGADVAAELDAKRAIDQGTRLALTL